MAVALILCYILSIFLAQLHNYNSRVTSQLLKTFAFKFAFKFAHLMDGWFADCAVITVYTGAEQLSYRRHKCKMEERLAGARIG